MLIPDPFWSWITCGSPHTGILKFEFCRSWQPGEWDTWDANGTIQCIQTWNGRSCIRVNNIYPVEPGRRQRPVGWVRIRSLRRNFIQYLADADARMQGFVTAEQFRDYYYDYYGGIDKGDCYIIGIEPLFSAQPEKHRFPSQS